MQSTGTRLSYLELLSVSWLIAWRYFILAMIFSLTGANVLRLGIVGILATLQLPHQTVLWAAGAFAYLAPYVLFYPLTVQMALSKEFRSFEIQATGDNGSPTSLTFLESLRAGLYFVIIAFLIALPVGLLSGIVVGATGSPTVYANTAGILWSLFVAQPIAIRLMLNRKFRSFQFEITRPGQMMTAPAPIVSE